MPNWMQRLDALHVAARRSPALHRLAIRSRIFLALALAAVLLLVPATRTLGAVVFLPILANVTVLTWSIGFTGTRWITPFMLLASVFLICWDWHRVRSILVPPESARLPPLLPLPEVERIGYVLGGGSGLLFLMAARDFGFLGVPAAILGVGGVFVAVVLVLSGWVMAWRAGVGRRRAT